MMSKNLFYALALCACLGFLSACEKAPIYDDTPSISFVGFSTDTIQQATGITAFIIGFTDGDGDLGSDENNVTNLFIIDERNADTMAYRIPHIPKQGVSSAISGEIEVDISNFCCIPTDIPIPCFEIANTYQQVRYKVIVRDNAGNVSNEILTAPLTLRCFTP